MLISLADCFFFKENFKPLIKSLIEAMVQIFFYVGFSLIHGLTIIIILNIKNKLTATPNTQDQSRFLHLYYTGIYMHFFWYFQVQIVTAMGVSVYCMVRILYLQGTCL